MIFCIILLYFLFCIIFYFCFGHRWRSTVCLSSYLEFDLKTGIFKFQNSKEMFYNIFQEILTSTDQVFKFWNKFANKYCKSFINKSYHQSSHFKITCYKNISSLFKIHWHYFNFSPNTKLLTNSGYLLKFLLCFSKHREKSIWFGLLHLLDFRWYLQQIKTEIKWTYIMS